MKHFDIRLCFDANTRCLVLSSTVAASCCCRTTCPSCFSRPSSSTRRLVSVFVLYLSLYLYLSINVFVFCPCVCVCICHHLSGLFLSSSALLNSSVGFLCGRNSRMGGAGVSLGRPLACRLSVLYKVREHRHPRSILASTNHCARLLCYFSAPNHDAI